MWYIKLDGENIIGHIDTRDPWTNPADWDASVSIERLINEDGDYKYKYVAGALVEMTQEEIDNHPLKVEKNEKHKLRRIHNLVIRRRAYIDTRDHPQVPQNVKDKAIQFLSEVNQELADIFGI